MNFDQIKKLKKRCDHFVGAGYTPDWAVYGGSPSDQARWRNHSRFSSRKAWVDRNDWQRSPYDGPAEGLGIAASNYSEMVPRLGFDTYTDLLLWLDDVAASFNRYIDANRIAEDEVAKRCLRWWRDHLFFAPEALS